MKTSSLTKLWVCLVIVLQLSCKKEEDKPRVIQQPPVTLGDMFSCHGATVWDSAAIQAKLIGTWNWEYIQCFLNTENGNYNDFKGLSVAFKPDNTLEVSMDGQLKQHAVWAVKKLNTGDFSIDVKPIVVQLFGRIYFCQERVLFNDSYTDGCDNYFTKKP